jgi:hypothetical protein
MFGKKKKTWFVKNFALKNHFLEMKLNTSFSKCAFNKKTWLENGLSNSLYMCRDKKLCIKIKKKTKCIFIKYAWQPVSGSLVSSF